jgi:HlyD family secretion protein
LQPGQAITQIAPQGSPLVFRAQMPSSESGFLRVGQPVKLKFDAYPFQDYGVVQGHLRWISPDSKVEETPQGKLETFELEIVLEQTYIQTQNKRVALTPGQTATAEVIVRQRHLIDFILDPFKKLQKGGVEL